MRGVDELAVHYVTCVQLILGRLSVPYTTKAELSLLFDKLNPKIADCLRRSYNQSVPELIEHANIAESPALTVKLETTSAAEAYTMQHTLRQGTVRRQW